MANGISTSGQQVINSTTAIDLVKTTLDHLEYGDFTETFALQRYPVCEGFFQKGRLDASGGGATGYQRRTRLDVNENSRGTRLYKTGALLRKDIMQTLYFPWVMHETGMIYEVDEINRNKGSAQIVDIVQTERSGMWEDCANYFERRGMLGPDSSTDDENPQGLLFHARFLGTGVTDPVGGFNATKGLYGDATDTTNVGNIDSSIAKFSRLRNFAATHNGVCDMQFLRQLRTAINRVGWRPPKLGTYKNPQAQTYSNFKVHWNQNFAEQYMEIVNSGPDDRNGNASPFWGDMPYGPVDTVSTPVLDSISNTPVIGIDFNSTKVITVRGRWLVPDEPMRDPTNHRVINFWYDSTYAIVCKDPRRNFNLHTVR